MSPQSVSDYVKDLRALRQEQVQHTIMRLTRLGWTQEEVAKQVGLTHQRVAQILQESPALEKLAKTDSASFSIEQVAERNRISHQLAASIGWGGRRERLLRRLV